MTCPNRRRAALLALAVAAAGCTSSEAVPPADPGTVPVPGATEPGSAAAPVGSEPFVEATAPGGSTAPDPTTDPAGTSSPESSTSASSTTTTLPPPSGEPTDRSTPLFAGGDPDGWLPVGRWTGTDWESAGADGDAPTDVPRSGTEMSVLEADLDPIAGISGSSVEACSDGRVGPSISPNARAPEEPGFGFRSIALPADWDPRPRPVASVDAVIESYVTAGREAFDGTDVDVAAGTIDQIVVSDLDGDGDTESLVAFGGSGYSSLLLIDADSGDVIEVGLDVETAVEPPAPEGSAPSTGDATPEPSVEPATSYRVLTVADLNGDGLMEIVTHAWVAGVATVGVITYDGDGVERVLVADC
ncbi:hypothetical protein [Ilumatobacter sp.]|uniref:hypothetical protein n=1 Tax=Ilumatobacter sp. TaxID=1967498 RepID=UPI003B51D5CB